MSIFSALKTLERSGKAALVPKSVKSNIKILENLGGRLDKANIEDFINADINFSVSQRDKLFGDFSKSGTVDELTTQAYNQWKKFSASKPDSKLAQRKARELDSALLRVVLNDVRKLNHKDNLDAVKAHNVGKKVPEMINFTKEFELRPAFPTGFQDLKIKAEPVDLEGLVHRTDALKEKRKEVNFKSLIKTEGNVTTVDFKSLKRLK